MSGLVCVEPAPGHYEQHVVFAGGGLALTVCLSPVPPHSPYQAGDWVRHHGYRGAMPGPSRWGWRGFVLGSYGAKILRGLTDDGQEWAESWGALVPDDAGPDEGCTCCPHPWRFPAPPKVEQLGLFDVFDLLNKEESSV